MLSDSRKRLHAGNADRQNLHQWGRCKKTCTVPAMALSPSTPRSMLDHGRLAGQSEGARHVGLPPPRGEMDAQAAYPIGRPRGAWRRVIVVVVKMKNARAELSTSPPRCYSFRPARSFFPEAAGPGLKRNPVGQDTAVTGAPWPAIRPAGSGSGSAGRRAGRPLGCLPCRPPPRARARAPCPA